MSQMFKVVSIRNVSWNNSIVRASIDLEVMPHGIIIKDCLLKEGQFGWFLSSPSKKLKEPITTKDGTPKHYLDIVFFPKAVREEMNAVCVEAYDPSGNYNHNNNHAGAQHPLTDQVEEVFGSDDGLPA